ncbi:MAG TPA: HAD family hydrolase [Blastocatellia bacterium]|nr:HAD family hydrolase [Blastocatellia bacterium]
MNVVYSEVPTEGGRAYIRADEREALASISALVFDCDGVLIDVRPSYDVAISRTVRYLLSKLFYRDFSPLATRRMIYRFRQSGGFNNDWDTVCALLLGTFVQLDDALLRVFLETDEHLGGAFITEATERLIAYVREIRRKDAFVEAIRWRSPLNVHQARARLLALADAADSSGLPSVERQIRESWELPSWKLTALSAFQRFLAYPGAMGESLVVTVFNEFFYGEEYCRTVFGIEPRFARGSGCVDHERPILTDTVGRRLAALFSGRLGIVSGRRRSTAEKTLGDRLTVFDSSALVFLEDEYDREHAESIGKPSPYGLLKARSALGHPPALLYVGDSAEDFIMVRRAEMSGIRCLFCGVYRYGYNPGARIRLFMDAGAALILPSVNELPGVLSSLKR